MALYATVQDLMDGWQFLSPTEQATAGVLIARASALLDAEVAARGADPSKFGQDKLLVCKIIVCDMVRYSFTSSGSHFLGEGYDGQGMTGELTGGSLMVTNRHMKMLGLGHSRAGFIGAVHE